MVGVRLVLWEIVGGRPVRDYLSQLLPFSNCFDLVKFSILDRTISHAEISNNGVRASDTDAGEVFRCWVQNGAFVTAGVGLVGVVPADLAERWAVRRFLVWRGGGSVHDNGQVGRVDVVPGT